MDDLLVGQSGVTGVHMPNWPNRPISSIKQSNVKNNREQSDYGLVGLLATADGSGCLGLPVRLVAGY